MRRCSDSLKIRKIEIKARSIVLTRSSNVPLCAGEGGRSGLWAAGQVSINHFWKRQSPDAPASIPKSWDYKRQDREVRLRQPGIAQIPTVLCLLRTAAGGGAGLRKCPICGSRTKTRTLHSLGVSTCAACMLRQPLSISLREVKLGAVLGCLNSSGNELSVQNKRLDKKQPAGLFIPNCTAFETYKVAKRCWILGHWFRSLFHG